MSAYTSETGASWARQPGQPLTGRQTLAAQSIATQVRQAKQHRAGGVEPFPTPSYQHRRKHSVERHIHAFSNKAPRGFCAYPLWPQLTTGPRFLWRLGASSNLARAAQQPLHLLTKTPEQPRLHLLSHVQVALPPAFHVSYLEVRMLEVNAALLEKTRWKH